jgi:cation diffusion facilitator CzcD-associated flavoprotein CzcO
MTAAELATNQASGAQPERARSHFRVAIVGSGFAGLGMARALKRERIDDFVVFERAGDLGGIWRDNTYPGCQCDVPSTLYSFSFAPNPNWTHTYPLQNEILEYLHAVAREERLSAHIRFWHEVRAARWDDSSKRWTLETRAGRFSADILVLGVGALAHPRVPALPGIADFQGTVFHSANWNHDHDLRGRRVAVIGTGASAIQFIPRIQHRVSQLYIFQRTPPWILPHSDRATTRLERFLWRAVPRSQHLWRGAAYAARESLVVGLALEPRLMRAAEKVAKAHLSAQVSDPQLRRLLTPRYRLGCKRILISNEYYPALCKPNVAVVDGGLQEIRSRSVLGTDGVERDVDTIIFGTGFHATDPPQAGYVWGRQGQLLADSWRAGMSAYLGTACHGFPNAFMLVGPNTGLGHSSMIYMIESQVAHVMEALRAMERRGAAEIEVRSETQTAYNAELQRKLEGTVWNSGGCRSWYLDAHGRNTTLWPSFTFRFRELARAFDPADYVLAQNGAVGLGN